MRIFVPFFLSKFLKFNVCGILEWNTPCYPYANRSKRAYSTNFKL